MAGGRAPVGARVGAVAVVLLSGCGSAGPPAAACAGPEVTLSTSTVVPGQEVRVQAGPLWSDCYDTGQSGTPPPMQDVTIVLEGEGGTAVLATVDADAQARIDVTVQVPEDLPAGPATLVVGGAPTPVRVVGP